MKNFLVTFEARQRGAIGIFSAEKVVVASDSEETAIKAAFSALQDAEMETRYPISVEPSQCEILGIVDQERERAEKVFKVEQWARGRKDEQEILRRLRKTNFGGE